MYVVTAIATYIYIRIHNEVYRFSIYVNKVILILSDIIVCIFPNCTIYVHTHNCDIP